MDELRRIRKLRGLSQQQLADRAGVGQDTISGLELGRHTPQGRTLQKLAHALNCDIADLYPREETPASRSERWSAYLETLTGPELEALRDELDARVRRLTISLDRQEMRDLARIDEALEVMQELRLIKERLEAVEKVLSTSNQ